MRLRKDVWECRDRHRPRAHRASAQCMIVIEHTEILKNHSPLTIEVKGSGSCVIDDTRFTHPILDIRALVLSTRRRGSLHNIHMYYNTLIMCHTASIAPPLAASSNAFSCLLVSFSLACAALSRSLLLLKSSSSLNSANSSGVAS